VIYFNDKSGFVPTGACAGPRALGPSNDRWASLWCLHISVKEKRETAKGEKTEKNFILKWLKAEDKGREVCVSVCVCVFRKKNRGGGLFSSLTVQLQHFNWSLPEVEITSASYGNCLACSSPHWPTESVFPRRPREGRVLTLSTRSEPPAFQSDPQSLCFAASCPKSHTPHRVASAAWLKEAQETGRYTWECVREWGGLWGGGGRALSLLCDVPLSLL